MKIKCIVIDDEPIARKGLAEYISEIDFLEPKGEGENAAAAAKLLNNADVDLIFLDMQMPKMTGIEFLKTLPKPPMVIFTTAYSEYALQGYELDILDYLVKPISFERFLKACNKAKELFDLKRQNSALAKTEDYFFIRSDNQLNKLTYSEVLYIEAMENYVVFHTQKGKHVSYLTLKGVESFLPEEKFLKVHKSFIIYLPAIEKIDNDSIIIKDKSIPISRAIKDEVVNKITANRLLKR